MVDRFYIIYFTSVGETVANSLFCFGGYKHEWVNAVIVKAPMQKWLIIGIGNHFKLTLPFVSLIG